MRQFVRAATRNGPLNILTFDTHERNQTFMAKTGHTFYAIRLPGLKTWNTKYAPVPPNYIQFDETKGENQIFPEIDFDLILSQNKFAHWHIANNMSQHFGIPLLHLEHCLPPPNWGPGMFQQYRSMGASQHVFISEMSRKAWGYEGEALVVRHGVDTEQFHPDERERQQIVLSVANDFVNRNWALGFTMWQNVVAGLPAKVVGDTPGLSLPAMNTHELINEYNVASIFLNTSLISPIPLSLLEAGAMECGIVSTNTCMIPEIFTHGHDALLCANERELREAVEQLLMNPMEARRLGKNARETIRAKCGLERYVADWNRVFNEVIIK